MRKGAFEWETVAKYLIAFIVLVILVLLIGLFKDKMLNALEGAKALFGGG